MRKNDWIIIIVYLAMHLSGIIGGPLIMLIGKIIGADLEALKMNAITYWLVFSFTAALIIILALMRKDGKTDMLRSDKEQASIGKSIVWAIGGIFLALIAQSIAANIEYAIGIEMGSDNTQQIMGLIEAAPYMILVVSIIGPILEEIVFRKVIFGSLYKRFNFFLSALISSIIFAAAHMEFEHIILYSAMGFTFAYLYVKTQRIIVPIFAHVSMNTLVVILQLNQDKLLEWAEKMEQAQMIVGGFL